jgi:hypothetical protein
MKYKIEVDYAHIYDIWTNTINFITEKMQDAYTPQEVIILERLHALSVRMMKKAFHLRFKGKNEKENFGFDFMELQLIQVPVNGDCLLKILLMQNNNSAVWALDQKIKSL